MAEKLHKENKKIKNAHPLEYKGIKFKSQLERMTYTTFKEKASLSNMNLKNLFFGKDSIHQYHSITKIGNPECLN